MEVNIKKAAIRVGAIPAEAIYFGSERICSVLECAEDKRSAEEEKF